MKTLIVYASKHGTAKRCSEILKDKLKGEVTITNIKKENCPNISSFDNIIIGGSIYIGRIQKEISNFCLNNLHVLKHKKIGLFICCMNKENPDKQLESSFPKALLDNAVVKECFGGEFNFKDMNFLEKAIIKKVSKEDKNIVLDFEKGVSMINTNNIDKFTEAFDA